MTAIYKVGIVAGTIPITVSQYQELQRRLKFIKSHGWQVELIVAAKDLRFPEDTLSGELRQLAKDCQLSVLPTHVRGAAPTVAVFLHACFLRADEIWCCIGAHQTSRAKARAMSLYRYAGGDRRYKLIPHYVEEPVQEAKTKGSTKWKERA